MRASFIYFILAVFSVGVFAVETVDFSQFRQEQIFAPFLGTYVSHDQKGRERLVSIWIEEGIGLEMWEVGGYPVFLWHDFSYRFPLGNHSQEEMLRGTGVRRIGGPGKRKKYFVKTEWQIIGPTELLLRKTETDKDGRFKSIEERRLITDGTSLHYTVERHFYRRKYVFWGPWLEDLSREIVRRNSRSVVYTYVKQSSHPMSFEMLEEIKTQRNRRLDAAYGSPSTIVADFNWEGFSILDDVKAAAEAARPAPQEQPARVLTFPGKKCAATLAGEAEE